MATTKGALQIGYNCGSEMVLFILAMTEIRRYL